MHTRLFILSNAADRTDTLILRHVSFVLKRFVLGMFQWQQKYIQASLCG